MKKNINVMLAAVIGLSVCFTSCKKIDKEENNTELSTHADDQARVAAETDAVANDADIATENFAQFSGRSTSADAGTTSFICDASTVLDSTDTERRITITYNGTNCSGTRTRTGVVVLTIPRSIHWRDAGAVLTVSIQNLKITRLIDNKSITINGIHTITNTSGGRLTELYTLGHIEHDIASPGMSITFDNGSQRTWQVSKHRVFNHNHRHPFRRRH